MSKKLRNTSMWLLALLLGLLAVNCSKPVPGEKEMLGKIKGKASLRLADGSTISRDDSDEYNPYLIKMDDGHLVLVFGSNRTCAESCSGHNIFVARSTTTFDGFNLPFFEAPLVVKISTNPALDSGSQISFAATKESTGVRIFANIPSLSGFIKMGDVTNFTNPTIALWDDIGNGNHETNTIIGISADGTQLYSTDTNGTGYAFSPTASIAADPFGYGMDYAESVTQVRQENSGLQDSILGTYYGTSYTAAGNDFFGGILDLDVSLLSNGLYLGSLSTFYVDDPYGDTVLFSAWDGISEDLYVITSHTAYDLWYTVPFFGFDQFLAPPPTPAHWWDFEFACATATDSGTPGGWDGSCTGVTMTATSSYNGSQLGTFGFGDSLDFSARDVTGTFSISAWIQIPSVAACSTSCPIIANAYMNASPDGFQLFVDSAGAVKFQTGDGSNTATAETSSGVIVDSQWHHVVVTVNQSNLFAFLYVDGVLQNMAFDADDNFVTNTALQIGQDGDSNNFLGDLDDVMIFGYELSPLEVMALATNF